ncbi:hydantoinase B/oxoprolinase family protein [Bosea sp. (in: a-proteobacteria)]|uniref:hydantoinase B/oxoprolinase family protein n=1 Tax=Bosea sp. (in: a-proteobacteria) TaxID=1871050 RepID=UPI00261D1C43|nr:hydantoinase B/oxoprolinase family protein [Bosea sp. (in: a-proteobacteria)]MCO5091653.1 hydantoinase B/oxoprolinase family protein [Bosea sp. (in: a-proteobacteria)]
MKNWSDAVHLQILNSRLLALTSEFAENILRAAHSTFVKETWDIAALLMTSEGEIVSSPREIGAKRLGMSLRKWLETKPSVKPGDIFISNDPNTSYMATHLNDLFFWKPVFLDGEVACYALGFVHVSDVGGAVPGSITPTSTDLFQEGVKIPPVKIVSEGVFNDSIREIIIANSRVPKQIWGDATALLGSLSIFESKLLDFISAYSIDEFKVVTEKLLSISEARARSIIRTIPNGTYRFDDYIDGLVQGDPIKLSLDVVVEDEEVTLDFGRFPPEVAAAYNVYSHSQTGDWGLTRAFMDFFQTTDPAIAWNSGLVRPVKVKAPKGSIVNPKPNAACGARVATFFRVYYMIFGALGRALQGILPSSGPGSTGVMLIATADPITGDNAINVGQALFGGCGARPGSDGYDSNEMVSWYLRNIPVELLEHELSVLFREYAYAVDTGGAGRHRGGHGTKVAVEFLSDATVTIRGLQRFQFRAWGVEGGEAGALGQVIVNEGTNREVRLDAVSVLKFAPGDTLSVVSPGGGGLGDPFARPADKVLGEFENGLVSAQKAAESYGVVIVDGRVDPAATQRLRSSAVRPKAEHFDFGEERRRYEARGEGA